MGEAREAEEGGDICIIMANSSMAETNTVLKKKSHFPVLQFWRLLKEKDPLPLTLFIFYIVLNSSNCIPTWSTVGLNSPACESGVYLVY